MTAPTRKRVWRWTMAVPTRWTRAALVAVGLACPTVVVRAQAPALPAFYAPSLPGEVEPPPVSREFRGVWVATVNNMDWPSRPGLPVDSQKAELLALLDRAAALRLNAVIFQVRPGADALYKSPYEPWSEYLTGVMGRAPSPAWDPLEFAVAEAHRRGLELHAWFNPYRARYARATSAVARTHVSRTMPEVVKRYGRYRWMDPGEESVRAHTLKVVLDVVRRYDIDGVHLDDYFYPYPERDRRGRAIPFPDDPSWARYQRSGGTLSRADWRRRNVDLLVESLFREIRKLKPWVKFGISPFGIWRPGFPATVRGLDAYEVLYADSRRWLLEGWVDYFTPQLYWAADAPQQRYTELLDWWAAQNAHGRHLWPGNGTFKVVEEGRSGWQASELLRQVDLTRNQPGASGNVHFNMSTLARDVGAVGTRLTSGPYAGLALVPASPWMSPGPPEPPSVTSAHVGAGITLRIAAGRATEGSDAAERPAPHGGPSGEPTTGAASTTGMSAPASPRWWLVRARYADGWRARLVDAATRVVHLPLDAEGRAPDLVTVNALDRTGAESPTVFAGPSAIAP